MARFRNLFLRVIDRWPPARALAVTMLATWYLRRGADDALVAEARRFSREREAKRSAEMLMWAAAVSGRAPFPTWFPASYHIEDQKNRERSAQALRHHLDTHPDAPSRLRRQYFLLSEPSALDEAGSFVASDLMGHLERTPPSHSAERMSLEHDQQLHILRRSVEALRNAGVRSFLISGTLLGVVRNGKLLDHDYDIDLGVLPGEGTVAQIANALGAAGFEVATEENKVVARDATGFAVDVFLHYERDGLLWHGTKIHEWWNTPFDLEGTELDGVPLLIPDDAPRYLDENYGDWRHRVAFYNFSFDTPNRRYRHNIHALLYLHRRFVTAFEAGDRWTVESAARELRDAFGVDVTGALQRTPLLEPVRGG